jgi:4'-phosphopantetheinyl transferase EntD
MPTATDSALQAAIETLGLPGMMIGHRFILADDDRALMAEEAPAFASSVVQVRRASGAARIVARQLLVRLGFPPCPVPKAASGAPVWPAGIVGSLAHDSCVAVAAVALRHDFAGVGIDIEPAESLPADLVDLVATPSERRNIGAYGGRLLFSAKEAVYKAVYPLDQTFLDFHDVEIDFANRKAKVRDGRVVELRWSLSTRLLALAFLPAVGSAEGGWPAPGSEGTESGIFIGPENFGHFPT